MTGEGMVKGARRARALVARNYLLVLLATAIAAGVWLVHTFVLDEDQKVFWSNVLADLFAALVTFVVVYVVLIRRGIALPDPDAARATGALVAFHARHEDVPWSDVIARARRVDIVVHYYNRWVREHFDAFVAVFQRGGLVSLVMADPEIPDTLRDVNRYFFPNLEERQLVDRVVETRSRLVEALTRSGSTLARLETRFYPEPLHYSLVLVDERRLFLSVYEQERGSVIRSSVFELDLLLDRPLEEYWLGNLRHFRERSRGPV